MNTQQKFIFDTVDLQCHAAQYHGGDRGEAVNAIRSNWASLTIENKNYLWAHYTKMCREAGHPRVSGTKKSENICANAR